jgi:hypothetical protein
MFGAVDTGAHSYRIFNIAIVDVSATVLVAIILHYLFPRICFWYILVALFLLGIVVHRLFCVRTTVDKFLFPNAQ